MAGLNLGGLASGMDTNTIVSQLMSIEAQGKTRLLAQQYRTEARKSGLDQIATRLRAFKTAAEDLRSVTSWAIAQTAESSDATKVGATYKSGAAVGAYAIAVTQLARADQRFYTYASDPAATTITLKAGTDAAVSVDIAAGADVNAAAAAINAKTDAPAYATVVDGQLVLSGKKTGVDLTVTATQLTEDAAKRRASRKAEYTIDGVAQTPSATNTVTGLPGIELTLKAVTSAAVTVNVGAPGPDQAALKTKVKAFVDSYNSVIDLVRAKLEEVPVKTPQLQSDYAKGALRGDPGLSGLLGRLRSAMGETFAGDPASPNPVAYNELSDIGVAVPRASAGGTSTREALAGKLTIDDAKLTAALSADPNAVKRLLGGISTIDGAAQRIVGIVDPVSALGSGDLAKRTEMIDREVTRIKDAQAAMDRRLKLKEERLRAQFTAMETGLNSTQSSMSWLNGQISGLAGRSS